MYVSRVRVANTGHVCVLTRPEMEKMYHFSRLAIELNEPEERVAPTDSRLRPDQRLMENGTASTVSPPATAATAHGFIYIVIFIIILLLLHVFVCYFVVSSFVWLPAI